MSFSAGSAFRALALGAFALFLLHSGVLTGWRCAQWIGQAVSLAGEDHAAVRRWMLGPTYVRGIERIRRTIPRAGAYLLVRGGTVWEGSGYFVGFELAPRRARYLGPLNELPDAETLRRSMPPGLRYVVIAYSEPRPPVLMEREDFLRAVRSHGRF
jgi:hypothetical protein